MEFRFKALQRMRAPDEIDTPIILAAPRGWIAVFVVMIAMAGAAVWAFAGRLPISVSATGLLSHSRGISVLQSPVAGMVRRVLVVPGEQITSGQTVADIGSAAQPQPVISPFSGRVVEVAAAAGQVVGPGSAVLTVERSDGPDDRLVALLFVPARSGRPRSGCSAGGSRRSARIRWAPRHCPACSAGTRRCPATPPRARPGSSRSA